MTDMRRRLVLLALVPGLLFGLWRIRSLPATETDSPSALMWNGTICYASVQAVDELPADAAVGTVSSETDTFPRKNGQANFCPPDTPVAQTEEGMAVLLDGVWYLCRPKEMEVAQADS